MSKKEEANWTIPEWVLIELRAQKDRGLKLTFEDVLEGMERNKWPLHEGIRIGGLTDRILDAYRHRTKTAASPPGQNPGTESIWDLGWSRSSTTRARLGYGPLSKTDVGKTEEPQV